MVDTELVGLHADDLTGDLGDLVNEILLNVLHSGSDAQKADTEILAHVGHSSGSVSTSLADVLHSFLEARICKGGLLGEIVVQAFHSTCECLVGVLTVVGELLAGLAKLLVCFLLSLCDLLCKELECRSLTCSILGGELLDGILSTLLLGSDGSKGALGGGFDLNTGFLRNLLHLNSICIDGCVGLLDGRRSLGSCISRTASFTSREISLALAATSAFKAFLAM